MTDTAFQDQVDRCLAALEAQQPAIHNLRRVPMDLIAEIVDRELCPLVSLRVLVWKDAAVQRALIAIAARNRMILAAPIKALATDHESNGDGGVGGMLSGVLQSEHR